MCVEKATCHFLWVGDTADNKTLEYAMISHGDEKWTFFDPSTSTLQEDIPPYLQRQIMRRFVASCAEGSRSFFLFSLYACMNIFMGMKIPTSTVPPQFNDHVHFSHSLL
jgi:hypothetical protein